VHACVAASRAAIFAAAAAAAAAAAVVVLVVAAAIVGNVRASHEECVETLAVLDLQEVNGVAHAFQFAFPQGGLLEEVFVRGRSAGRQFWLGILVGCVPRRGTAVEQAQAVLTGIALVSVRRWRSGRHNDDDVVK